MPTLKELVDELGFTYSELALRMGKSRQRIATLGGRDVREASFLPALLSLIRERQENLQNIYRDLMQDGAQEMLCRTTYGPDGVAITAVLDQVSGDFMGAFRWRVGARPADGMGLLTFRPMPAAEIPVEEGEDYGE